MRGRSAGTLVVLMTAGGAFAQPREPIGDPAKVTALVELLRSPDYRVREAAGRDLLALGEPVLPALQTILPRVNDPECSCRLQAIVGKLNRDRLEQPRRVTLRVSEQTPQQLIAEIARQSGYPIRCAGRMPGVKLSFALVEMPFWEALDRVCAAAGLVVMEEGDDGRLSVGFHDTHSPHVSYDGPFKVVATYINSGRSLPLAGLNRRQPNARQPEGVNLSLSVLSEPKVPIVGVGIPVLTRAVDDRGGSLLAPGDGPGDSYEARYLPGPIGFRTYNAGFGLNLLRSDRSADSIKELCGTLPVTLLADTRPEITVPEMLKASKQSFEGRSVALEILSADFREPALVLNLAFRKRTGDPDDYSWLNTLALRVEVYDAAGARLKLTTTGKQTNATGACRMELHFSTEGTQGKTGSPTTLRFVEWLTVTRDVKFLLKDVPLP